MALFILVLLALTPLGQSQSNPSPDSCCFSYTTPRRVAGHQCRVCLSPRQLCSTNPCPRNEYCRLRNGQPTCCTVESRQFGTAFGTRGDQVNCNEQCLRPPSTRPSPPFPICPDAVPHDRSQPRPRPTLPVADGSRATPKPLPLRPTLPVVVDRSRATPAPRNQFPCPAEIENGKARQYGALVMYGCDPGFLLDGASTVLCMQGGYTNIQPPKCVADPPVCTFCQPVRSGQSCRVELRRNQLCRVNPCRDDEYCKMRNARPSCCKQEFFRLSTANGLDTQGCRENCVYSSSLSRPSSTACPLLPCPTPAQEAEPSTESPTPTQEEEDTAETATPTPKCPPLPELPDGAVAVDGSKASYGCNEGFYLKPKKSERVCQDGVWSGKTPRCAPRKECTRFSACSLRVCVKGSVYCSRSVCPEGQYCRRKNGQKDCCQVFQRPGDTKCVKQCRPAPN